MASAAADSGSAIRRRLAPGSRGPTVSCARVVETAFGGMRDRIKTAAPVLAAALRRRWWVVLIIVALVVAVGLGIALSLYQLAQTEPLMRQADALPIGETRVARQREILQFQADNLAKIWTTIVQAIGAVVLAIGGYFTWRNLRVAQEAQITNRFTQAIGQLGAELKDGTPNLEVRLGGIYALERIARDSPRDHWTIMEVLTNYVRQNAPWPPRPHAQPAISPWRARKVAEATAGGKPRADIQAILTVLGRRKPPQEPPEWRELGRLDLTGADLREADLSEATLSMAQLSGAILSGAILREADLREAYLTGAKNLTADQVKSAASRDGARLPREIAEELDGPATESAETPPSASPAS